MSSVYSDSDSESSNGDEGAPPFKLVSSATFRRLAELAPAASHNGPPTTAELRLANDMQEETAMAAFRSQQMIMRIDAQIDALQRQKRTVLGEATTQQSVLELCKKIKAPIRRVPLDILKELALHVALTSRSKPSNLASSPSLVFAQVCSTWRSIALSTPELWSTLHLDINYINALPIYTQRVLEWFRRAKTRPTSFFIYFGLERHDIENYVHSHLHDFFVSLSPAITNTIHLGLHTYQMMDLQTLFEVPLECAFSGLHQLDIQSLDRDYYSYYPTTDTHASGASVPGLRLFKSTPSLTNLIINTMVLTRDNFPGIVPWSQLTRLCISKPVNVLDWISFMKFCPNLRTGVFSLKKEPVRSFSLPRPALQSNIQNLSLELDQMCYFISFVDLFCLFQMPKLTKLDLIRRDEEEESETFPFPLETDTSGPIQSSWDLSQLKYLSICRTKYLHMTPILWKAANLSELKLTTSVPFPSTLIESLTYDIGRGTSGISGNILPNLSTLKIDIKGDLRPEDTDLLLRMLLSRRDEALPTGCQHLDGVIINASRPFADYLLSIGLLERCKKSGLRLDIRHQEGSYSFQELYVPRVTPFAEALWMDD